MLRRFAAAPLLAAALLGVSGPARAQDRSAAAALFEKGLTAMKAKDFVHGCPALAESYKLDPLPGTLFTVAECQASAGQLASALVRYGDFLALVQTLSEAEQKRQQARVDRTKKQVEDLEKRAPRLTLTLPAKAPPGTTVQRDGQLVPAAVLGVAVPVDIGEHVLVTTAPGGAPKETRLTVADGEKKAFEVPVDETIPKPTAAAAPPPPMAAPPPTDERPSSSANVPAYVAFGVGVVGIGVGSVFGIEAISKKKTVDKNCTGSLCNDTGLSASKSMKTDGAISTVGFAVGGAAALAGVLPLVLHHPDGAQTGAASVTPVLLASPNGGFIGAAGAF